MSSSERAAIMPFMMGLLRSAGLPSAALKFFICLYR